ncbi:hypothetical protein BDK51DRAFT_46559 [Blyttiomyces helicus]|uniref:Uncharacterized protein n=1 Tax=Blyttiomyces helicus TaxID=388810 RepID=A0A4P9WLS5_9FUNG|nr:hypothetical protein BDK51DRAFT_46559 [Blyttiomyces helicus]|eukprot:RKO94001.1 hypothetical protein BDK51DRAFT_46559 [Blyttiomyces helicus]
MLNIKEFLGVAVFFKSCIKTLAEFTCPLTALTSNGLWTWGPEEETMFTGLYPAAAPASTLATYLIASPTYAFSYASPYAIGSWFGQPKDGTILDDNPPKKELLALVKLLDHGRPYMFLSAPV